MEKKMVDVTIHLDEDTSHANREDLRDALLAMGGVMAVDVHDEKPHLMMVEYDPDTISSEKLLGKVKDRGLHAELIGL